MPSQLCYRISKASSVEDAILNFDRKPTFGRWNFNNRKVICASSSEALTFIEARAMFGLFFSTSKFYLFSFELPMQLIQPIRQDQLPAGWNSLPATDISRAFAERELFNKDRLALAVPSVIVPNEFNIIINPIHSTFRGSLSKVTRIGKLAR